MTNLVQTKVLGRALERWRNDKRRDLFQLLIAEAWEFDSRHHAALTEEEGADLIRLCEMAEKERKRRQRAIDDVLFLYFT